MTTNTEPSVHPLSPLPLVPFPPLPLNHFNTGRKAGTLFLGNADSCGGDAISLTPSTSALAISDTPPAAQMMKVEEVAKGARKGSRKLQDISSEDRSAVLMQIALSLELREQEILTANMVDVEAAEKRWSQNHYYRAFFPRYLPLSLSLFLILFDINVLCFTAYLSHPLFLIFITSMTISGLPSTTLSRLKLTSQKIKTLVDGIRSIAKQDEPIGEVSSATRCAGGIVWYGMVWYDTPGRGAAFKF